MPLTDHTLISSKFLFVSEVNFWLFKHPPQKKKKKKKKEREKDGIWGHVWPPIQMLVMAVELGYEWIMVYYGKKSKLGNLHLTTLQ